MLYSFLTSDDLETAVKEDQLEQLLRGDLSLVGRSEAAAVSRMKDYLTQRYNVDDIFPVIGEWAGNNTYGPARLVTTQVPLPQQQPGNLSLYERAPESGPQSYTPLYERNAAGRIVNYAWHAGIYYEALTDSLNIEPGNEEANPDWQDYWRERDPRDVKVVKFCTDIAVFYLHTRIAPRKIPAFRTDLYNEAKEWLEMVRDSALTPDLPRAIKPDDSGDFVRWGSNPSINHYY